jgi:hypothetical protein
MDPAGELRIFEDGRCLKALETAVIRLILPSKFI